MKPNDLATWAGRNGETRHGKVAALIGIYALVECVACSCEETPLPYGASG